MPRQNWEQRGEFSVKEPLGQVVLQIQKRQQKELERDGAKNR